jgi:hypothetical protein
MSDAPRYPLSIRRIAADAIRDRAREYEQEVATKPAKRRSSSFSKATLKIAAQLRALADEVQGNA